MNSARKDAFNWIDANQARMSALCSQIWHYAEPAWREYRSAAAYVDLLRAEGFDVEAGSGEMPTAFCATWGSGGPLIGAYAEYDAVPGNSQQPVPYPAPREGLHPWAAGHTDPHSMLGVAGLSGVLAAKSTMEQQGLPGRIRFFGEPAEKVCGSKPVHAAKGYYDGVDAFIAYHPHAANTTVWETHCGSYWSVVFSFECKHPERWGRVVTGTSDKVRTSPHTVARCPGAIDALMLMYTTTKYAKEAMFPHTGAWTLNEFVMSAGDATADNLPPRLAQIQYSWRSPDLAIQQRIYDVLENNARHAAAATGCEVSARWVTRTRVGLPNNALAAIAWENMQLAGPPRYSSEAIAFAQDIQRNLGMEPMEEPFAPTHSELIDPEEHERRLRTLLPSWQLNYTSDDYVEYTWHAPTVRIFTARPTLRPPHATFDYPSWIYNATGGRPEIIDPGLFLAAKTIAGTMLELMTDASAVARCREEFSERTGGGVGGSKWVAPLLPPSFKPPVDLRWPEYISTVRGEEWWIPTPDLGASIPLS